ncbi:hypothetical protein RJL32_003853 [Salmonella enterica]|nr:hypothetical protein [Salmonella enterica]
MNKLMFIFTLLSLQSYAAEPTFALKVASWVSDYQVSISTPSVMHDGSELSVSMITPQGTTFFSASAHLTHGGCDNVKAMDIQDVLAIPKFFTSNGVEFEYVRAEGDLAQVVNMYDGRIGLAATANAPQNCEYYMDLANRGVVHGSWLGSGRNIKAIYRIKKLPVAGNYTLNISLDSYFTRRERGSRWANMGSLSGYQNRKVVTADYQITAWCRVVNQNVTLDHKIMTPNIANGHLVSSDVRLECGGGGKGVAKLTLSNKSDKSTVSLGNGVKSEVSLSESKVDVAKDSSVNVTVSSRLTADSKKITAGELNGTEVLTVEWL